MKKLDRSHSKSVLDITSDLDSLEGGNSSGAMVVSEGNRRRIEMLQRLKKKNEEVDVRRELVRINKEREEEERIQ